MHDEGVRREARRGEVFDEGSFTSYVFSLLDSEGIWVDAAIYGNHSRYINHEQDTYNVEPKILYVNGEYRIRFSATRNIQAGEELFFNYGNNFPNLTKKMIKDKTAEEDGPYLEIDPRIKVLNERCRVFLDLAEILSDSVADSKMSYITWIVIILIVISILVTLTEVGLRFILLSKNSDEGGKKPSETAVRMLLDVPQVDVG
ncbi:hypothetical protein BN1723_017988, partial [Verticillium longisporum]